jgi:hypothetical protein
VWDNFDRRQKAKAAANDGEGSSDEAAAKSDGDPDMFGHAGVAAE